MFGPAMATFVPPMLPGTVVFTRSFAPEEIVRQIRRRRVSVLVCVPKILEVLRAFADGHGRRAIMRLRFWCVIVWFCGFTCRSVCRLTPFFRVSDDGLKRVLEIVVDRPAAQSIGDADQASER